ncbi:hypothetical protein ACFL3S_11160, partial [Gemmatimonadota bacterium]
SIATGSYQGRGTLAYDNLPANGRRIGDLLLTDGTVVIPGLPAYTADLMVSYEKPLLEEGGTIVEIGDLGGSEARDTIALAGLFVLPADTALDRSGGGVQIRPGAPAHFTVARRDDGSDVLWRFQGGPPARLRSPTPPSRPSPPHRGRRRKAPE